MPYNKNSLSNLKLFSSEYQPTPEAKSRGHKKAAAAREVALQALRGAEITDPKMLTNLRRIFPREKKFYGYHVVVGRLYNLAENGSVKAIEKLLTVSGDLDTRPTLEVGGTPSINITTATDKGQELISDLLNGAKDEQGI